MIKKILLLLAISAPFLTYFFYTKLLKVSRKKYPIKILSIISLVLVIISLGSLRYYNNYLPNLTEPNISLKPLDVLTIQLNSLQRNNIPFNDAGIEQVWKFAHPKNKKITGPLDNFKRMIKGDSYQMMIDHLSHTITLLGSDDNWAQFEVVILDKNKIYHKFNWQVEKYTMEGTLKDCWLTTMVSSPIPLGSSI